MKRRIVRWMIGAVGLALMTVAMVRADTSGYTFERVTTLGEQYPGTNAGQISPDADLRIGSSNAEGGILIVCGLDGGDGAVLFHSNGQPQGIVVPGNPSPAGGTFQSGLDNKVSLNDSSNLSFGCSVDRGSGASEEVLFVDRAASKWSVIATKGTPVPGGGTIEATVGPSTLNSGNDIVFTAKLADGIGVFIWDANAKQITQVAGPGTKFAGSTFTNYRQAQISDSRIITFEGEVDGVPGVGAYMAKEGEITELASSKTDAPDGSGKSTGQKFTELRGAVANANGDVAVMGQTADGWGAYLYTAKDKKLFRIAGPGDGMTGGGKLVNIESTGRNSIRIGPDGSVLFSGQNDDSAGVYLYKDGKISVVARTGQDLAGVGKAKNMANKNVSGWGLGYASNGLIAFTVRTDDDKVHLVRATPVAPRIAGL